MRNFESKHYMVIISFIIFNVNLCLSLQITSDLFWQKLAWEEMSTNKQVTLNSYYFCVL
jgi:NADH:ubiquinone oxidoreductase subunit 3 (subunit A)